MRKASTTSTSTSADKAGVISLVEPYCIDISLRTFTLLTELLKIVCDCILKETASSSSHGTSIYEGIAVCIINIVKVNLRRLVVSRVNPENIGIVLIGKDTN
jgi:hypothetical protein